MKSLSFIKAIAAITLLNLYACAPVYQPNIINTPLLSKRHDTRIAAYISLENGYDAQTAYAISDHIGIMFNGYYKNWHNPKRNDIYIKNYLFEGGLGYFYALDELRLEAYAGYGIGQNDSRFKAIDNGYFLPSSKEFSFTANMQRFFVQGSFGYASKSFEIASSLRYARVYVDEFYTDRKTRGHFIEPVVTLKYGVKNLKLVSQTGLCLGVFTNQTPYGNNPLILSIGLEGSIGARQKTPSTTPPVTY